MYKERVIFFFNTAPTKTGLPLIAFFMKNYFFIFALCVSVVSLSCRSTTDTVNWNTEKFQQQLTQDAVLLLNNSPNMDWYQHNLYQTLDSLAGEKGYEIHTFSSDIDITPSFVFKKGMSEEEFILKVADGYMDHDIFGSTIKHLNKVEKSGGRVLVISTTGETSVIGHYRTNLPDIKKLAKEKDVEVTFVFLCIKNTVILSAEELHKKIKNMKYPVNAIQCDCPTGNIQQWNP